MAKIVWQKRAIRVLDERIAYASAEFGKATAKRWIDEIAHAEARISSMPMSYTPEPLLEGKKHVYRYCHLMNRRFKLIYCYYPSSGIVRIADIWDTRINPETLKRRIK
ncbi:MAG: type II toxin-antitoxin system RelE/ParE family toxin [Prevotella sp.]|nr:type II toxin-antitoxin system RelE/ParE family toxin [Prevotella sp.]